MKRSSLILISALFSLAILAVGTYFHINRLNDISRQAQKEDNDQKLADELQREAINQNLAKNPIYFKKSDGTYKLTDIDTDPVKISEFLGNVNTDGTKIIYTQEGKAVLQNLDTSEILLTKELLPNERTFNISPDGKYYTAIIPGQSAGDMEMRIYDNSGTLIKLLFLYEPKTFWVNDSVVFPKVNNCEKRHCNELASFSPSSAEVIKLAELYNDKFKTTHVIAQEDLEKDEVVIVISDQDHVRMEDEDTFRTVWDNYEAYTVSSKQAGSLSKIDYESTLYYRLLNLLEENELGTRNISQYRKLADDIIVVVLRNYQLEEDKVVIFDGSKNIYEF